MQASKSAGAILSTLLFASAAQAAPLHLVRVPVEAVLPARAAVLVPRFSPAARALIAREAAREVSSQQISFARAREAVVASHLATSPQDIDALVEGILMQCADEAQAELQAEVAQMQNALRQKKALRGQVAQMKAAQQDANARLHDEYASASQRGRLDTPRFTLDDYTAARAVSYQQSADQIQSDLDNLNALSETEQLKLQELSDARSKALETLSNVMKSISDERKTITDNMK